jgi:hypothetical protein
MKLAEGRQLSKKALGLDPTCFSAWFAQSLFFAKKGRPEQADKMIAQILASDLNGQESLQGLLIKMQSNLVRFDS